MECIHCGCTIGYCGIGRKPKYCDSCSYIINLEKTRKRQKMKRKYAEELGTRNFGSKMKRNDDGSPNFLAELRAIRKERRSLGLSNGNSKATKK